MAGPMADPALSPQQAVQALADIARHEDRLTSRVGALTGMVWGIVAAAIFTTYAVAADLEPRWLLSFLWAPWTVAGVLVSVSAWKLHAISLRRELDRRQALKWGLGFFLLFVVALVLLRVLDLQDSAFSYMLVVNGLVGLIIAAGIGRHHGYVAAIPMALAGLAIVAGAFVLPLLWTSSQAVGFASAGLVGVAFVTGSFVSFVRG